MLNVDVSPSKVKDRIPEALATSLLYASVNWAYHVTDIKFEGKVAREVMGCTVRFL